MNLKKESFNSVKRLAIVPARGGSKRIVNKNIRDFCGKPIINYILDIASKSSLFKVIHVSTDSDLIRDVVTEIGFKPDFPRLKNLSDDYTPLLPVLKSVVEEYARRGEYFDEIWLLMPCAPLIVEEQLIGAAIKFYECNSCTPVLAVTEYPAPIEWAFTLEKNFLLTPVKSGMFTVRSQDLQKHYFDAGSFAIYPPKNILGSFGAGTDLNFMGYILPKGTAIDIDDEQDWELAENLYSARFHSR
jgi:N-acylneuraminate cytidylyltransferase